MRHLLYISAILALSGCLAGRSGGDHVAPYDPEEPEVPVDPAPFAPEAARLDPGEVYLAPEVPSDPETCTPSVVEYTTFATTDPRCAGSPVGRITHLRVEIGTGCTPASTITVCDRTEGPFVDVWSSSMCGGAWRMMRIDYDAQTLTDITSDVSGSGCVVYFAE